MKHFNYIFLVLLLLAGTIVFQACSAEELPGNGTENNGILPLTVKVSDGGYTLSGTPQGPDLSTRATENAYKTVFTAGDRIGIYAVKDGAIVNGVENLCLLAMGTDDGGLQWSIPDDVTLPVNVTYYAYYPYQSVLNGSVDLSATDATGFFADVVSAWTPATDQSTYTLYNQQDLMTAKGIVSGLTLTFPLEHRMALVVINLPKVKYTFTNTAPAIPPYYIDAPGTQFNGFSPCRMGDSYRYIALPGTTTAAALTGGYTHTSGYPATWSLDANKIAAGSYKTFPVDGADVVSTVSHNLQPGDFFMKDGTLISTDEALTTEQKSNCIGLVFTTRTGSNDQGRGWEHGYVMALARIDGSQWAVNGATSVDTPIPNLSKLKDAYTDLDGYDHTQAILKSPDIYVEADYPAFYTAKGYNSTVVAPLNTSGWFLPSIGQLWDIWENLGGTATSGFLIPLRTAEYTSGDRIGNMECITGIKTYTDKTGKGQFIGWSRGYVSSTEGSAGNAYDLIFYSNIWWHIIHTGKAIGERNSQPSVVPVLAF